MKTKISPSRFFLFILSFSLLSSGYGQQSVIMQHNDAGRTGWYNKETSLTTTNVKPGFFGKVFERAVDDQLYAQPLILSRVNIPGTGTKNLLIAATVNNTVYAFDADSANVPTAYWQRNLTPSGSRPVKATDMTGACGGGYRDFSGNIGIVGTPAIDTTTNTLYLVARSLNTGTGTYAQYLHALDVVTGTEKFNGPMLITASVNGNGVGNVNGIVNFDPQKNNQRPGLLLAGGIVYIAWSSHCDWGPYHGWIIGYDMVTLEQKIVYATTPEGYYGGIWMSGAGPALDENGNLYVAVGNGSVGLNNDPTNPVNRSESAIKLTPSGNTLSISSYFTPNNIAELEAADLDFGVTQIMLIPNTNRAMTGCKDGNLYLLDRDNMGAYNPASNDVVQTIDLGNSSHLRSAMSYYRGAGTEFVYSWSENALLKAFPYDRTNNNFDVAHTVSSGVQGPQGNSGAVLSVSSNASADPTAILWASYAVTGDANQSVRPGVLRAFSANDITKELWNSTLSAADNPGSYAKFNCPVIANGKVYLGTFSNKVVVYGLINGTVTNNCSSTNIALNKTAEASSVSNDNLNGARFAVDGNLNTNWNSLSADPQWISVDLGNRYDLCRVLLRWGASPGKNFTVQVSDNKTTWLPLASMTNNTIADNDIAVIGSGRYVRILATSGGTPSGYALREFEIYGTQSAHQCPEPVQLSVSDIYENSATLHWVRTSAGQVEIQYKTVSGASWTVETGNADFVQLNALACATDYLYRTRTICGPGDTSAYSVQSSFSTLSCNSNCGPLPTRWTTQDIGNTGAAGSACYSNGVYELHGAGTDIWGDQDAFHFAYKTFLGDGNITARVIQMDNTNPWNKCGIMFRETLSPGSRHAFVALTDGNGAAFENRPATDGESFNFNSGPGTHATYWIRLSKEGTVYTAFVSPDGNTWTQLGTPVDVGFGDGVPIYAGLALSSHEYGELSTATVDHFTVGGDFVQFNLQSFTGVLNLDKTVSLNWVTTAEQNIQSFIVERGNNLNDFVPIDTVAANNGGDFTETYDSKDLHPAVINYYRLRITNNNGDITYSQPVFIRVTDSNAPLLYPNPASGIVHIVKGSEAITVINLYDVMGRSMKSINNSGSNDIIDLPVQMYANGVYFVEIRTAQSVYTVELVIRN